ncbi:MULTISPECIES: ABC transporter substrate-binding protein [unclassified Methylobacterium]|uniref:ABC transporter substrate-binding protein n=1 Tax=unclassified Methylobacterium TaxID=2615210 RepID=UPI0011C20277|nr:MULTISPECIES: ABC transporter substrate-binding protein [unclassified Methylobacterium]QEE38462.1 ABC transporter substrate-binding protein [Methylobacterium sp. WL1]TXN56555.1 ABC transporter substrate-binding protein [Methylobacterium sp. WL2]
MTVRHRVAALTGLLCALGAGAALAADLVPVKIGVLNDRSGVYFDSTGEGAVVAARMAVEDFKPETQGLKVEVVAADHQNKPDVGASITRQWYDRDGVDAVFDVPTSSVALAVAQITKEKNKAFINSGGGTADLTGPACTPNTVHWTYDTAALANGTGKAMLKRGGKSWYFITADYAFGLALERDTKAVVEKSGGTVVGGVRTPFPNPDFSSFLLQAQASGAQVIGLADAGLDAANAIKQAHEFGIRQGGQTLAALLIAITDIHSLGLEVAQGLAFTASFYWDLNDGTRAFAERFGARMSGRKPTSYQAGVYASTLHYLKAVAALHSAKDGAAVVAKMKELPTDDPLFGKGTIRPDGRKIHPMYLFEAKTPAESKGEWDLYKVLETIPAEQAFRPMSEGGCPMVAGLRAK